MGIRIRNIGSYVPEKILTNDDLSKFLSTSDEWIYPRTGIRRRHIAAPEEQVSDMAAEAARKVLKEAGVAPSEIGAILLSSTSPECLFPASACLVQEKIGAKNAFTFDIQAACSGFVYSLENARCIMKGNPSLRYILVVASEKMSAIVDWENRDTCVLFGDGAAALLLENDFQNTPDTISPAFLATDGAYFDSLLLPGGGSRLPLTPALLDEREQFLHMDGKLIFKLAVAGMVECSNIVLERAGLTPSEIDWFVPHQANIRIVDATAERLCIPTDRVFRNVEDYGNTCAATIGIALSDMRERGLLKPGQILLLAAVGAGLSKGAMLVRW